MTELLATALCLTPFIILGVMVIQAIKYRREIEKRKIWRATLDEISNDCPGLTDEQLEKAAEKEAYRPKGER